MSNVFPAPTDTVRVVVSSATMAEAGGVSESPFGESAFSAGARRGDFIALMALEDVLIRLATVCPAFLTIGFKCLAQSTKMAGHYVCRAIHSQDRGRNYNCQK